MAEIDSNSGLNKTISEQKGACRKKLSLNEHALRKRQVFKFVTSDRDIYVNNKTPFKVSHVKVIITFQSLQLRCRFKTNAHLFRNSVVAFSQIFVNILGTIIQMRETA